jgi:hypothetical protein
MPDQKEILIRERGKVEKLDGLEDGQESLVRQARHGRAGLIGLPQILKSQCKSIITI